MAKDTVQVDIVANTQKASASLTKFAGYATAAAAAVVGITKAVNAMHEAYAEQEQAEARLAATLQATGNQVGITADEMKRFASEMQEMTTFGDEAVIGAQALMTTFTQIGRDVFPDAIRAAGDMSAMFGQDLEQSVIQLGTALNDPIAGIGRLRRIGVSFTEEQKNTIKAFMDVNDTASAQAVILDELQVEFGGVAEAMAETAGGAKTKLSNAFGDLMEKGGGFADKVLTPLNRRLTDMINNLNEAIDAKRAWNKVFGDSEEATASDFELAIERQKEEVARLAELVEDAQSRLANMRGADDPRLSGMAGALENALAKAEANYERQAEKLRFMVMEAAKLTGETEQVTDTTEDTNKELTEQQLIFTRIHGQMLRSFEIAEQIGDVFGEQQEMTEKQALVRDAINTLLREHADIFDSENVNIQWMLEEYADILDYQAEINSAKEDEAALVDDATENLERQVILEQARLANAQEIARTWSDIDNNVIGGMDYEGQGAGAGPGSGSSSNVNLGEVGQMISSGSSWWEVLVNAFLDAASEVEEFSAILNSASTTADQLFEVIGDEVADALRPIVDGSNRLTTMLGGILEPLLEKLAPVMQSLNLIVESLVSTLYESLAPVLNLISAILQPLAPVLDIVGTLVNLLVTPLRIVSVLLDALTMGLSDLIGGALSDVGDTFDEMNTSVDDYMQELKEKYGVATNEMEDITNSLSSINSMLSEINSIQQEFVRELDRAYSEELYAIRRMLDMRVISWEDYQQRVEELNADTEEQEEAVDETVDAIQDLIDVLSEDGATEAETELYESINDTMEAMLEDGVLTDDESAALTSIRSGIVSALADGVLTQAEIDNLQSMTDSLGVIEEKDTQVEVNVSPQININNTVDEELVDDIVDAAVGAIE